MKRIEHSSCGDTGTSSKMAVKQLYPHYFLLTIWITTVTFTASNKQVDRCAIGYSNLTTKNQNGIREVDWNATGNICTVTSSSANLIRQGRKKNSEESKKKPNIAPPIMRPPIRNFQDLVDLGKHKRFQVKHMFWDGRHGSAVNSFKELTATPEKLRQYLIDLNRRMYKGGILPMTVDDRLTFSKWVEGARRNPKKISLVDGNFEEIRKDIINQQGFKKYLEALKTRKGKKPSNLFTTGKKYPITEIVLSMDGNDLVVTLNRYKARVTIGMRGEEVYHWDPFDQSEIKEKVGINDNPPEITYVDVEGTSSGELVTRFTETQLYQIETTTLEFWDKLFEGFATERKLFKGPLNDLSYWYNAFVEKFQTLWDLVIHPPSEIRDLARIIATTPGGCASKSLGGGGRMKRQPRAGCSIAFNEEGEVDSIYPEEFRETYEAAGSEGRRRMMDILKNNRNKVFVSDELSLAEAGRQLNQMFHHNEMTVHTEMVELTGRIQDSSRWNRPHPETPSEMVTIMEEGVRMMGGRSRLSSSTVVNGLAKHPAFTGMEKAAKGYGYAMLGKGLITGIIHNDTTAIAVIGSRIGYDMVTHGGAWAGTKFFTAASKVGKAARVLGKVAGPLGGVFDVGLGVWALTKSVGRLKSAENAYERDDAIADIVNESIDVAVGAVVTVLSVAFPPAAPLIMAVGFVINVLNALATNIYKASNEVARINSEIPLLGFEKANVFESRIFDFFGTREKDYIDYLVEQKHANDLAVKNYLDFLKTNKQFLGAVFPSRQLEYDGGCTLKLYTYVFPFSQTEETVGTGCDKNGPCGPKGQRCEDSGGFGWGQVCYCEGKPKTNFGVAKRDSYVDFRRQQSIYWERAVPGDVHDTQFKCKPGSLEYSDYRIHQQSQRTDYYCQNAIGIYRPESERKPGQSFLVNLENGTDTLITDQTLDTTPYTFWLGEEGYKTFYGGNARNDFIINGDCSGGMLNGVLHGTSRDDTLVIAPSCAKGKGIWVGQSYNDAVSVKLPNKLDLQLQKIENIVGRPNEAENLDTKCLMKGVYLNGGSGPGLPDTITIRDGCSVNTQIVMSNYTTVESSADEGDIMIFVGPDIVGSKVIIKQIASRRSIKSPITTKTFFTKLKAEQVIIDSVSYEHFQASFQLKDSSGRDPFTFTVMQQGSPRVEQQQLVYFNEASEYASTAFSVLLVPGNKWMATEYPLMFLHDLQRHRGEGMIKFERRVGSPSVPNYFNVTGHLWNIQGGAKDDTFFVSTDLALVIINGGEGHDTLILDKQTWKIVWGARKYVTGIETVVKADNAGPLKIESGCSFKELVVKSEKYEEPDEVYLSSCPTGRALQVDAGGKTRVFVEGDIKGETDIVQVVAHETSKSPVMFELDARAFTVPGLFIQMELSKDFIPTSLFVKNTARNSDGSLFSFQLEGEDGTSYFNLKNLRMGDTNKDEDAYITSPHIQLLSAESSVPSQLVFERENMIPTAVHVLDDNGIGARRKKVIGFEKIQNVFQILNGSWDVMTEGTMGNTLICSTLALTKSSVKVDGEPGDEEKNDNTLIIKEDAEDFAGSKQLFHIDLASKTATFPPEGSGGGRVGRVEGIIQTVIGRTNQPDKITVGCDTRSVASRGALEPNYPDEVVIDGSYKNCGNNPLPLEVHLERYTKVENTAEFGEFKYFWDLGDLAVTNALSLHPSKNNAHKVVFTHVPFIQSIRFDKGKEVLTFKISDSSNGDGHVQDFPMFRENGRSAYINPEFLLTFSSPSTTESNSVTASVKVDEDGNTIATQLLRGNCTGTRATDQKQRESRQIRGLPVDINNFLVQLSGSERRREDCGGLGGHEESVENHFWMESLSEDTLFIIEGSQGIGFATTNVIHLGNNFHKEKPIMVDLSQDAGFLKREGVATRVELRRIDSFEGRTDLSSYDKVIPSCITSQVSGVELVSIEVNPKEDCEYNLIIGMEEQTRVQFGWRDQIWHENGTMNLPKFRNSTFHYRFDKPMSFRVHQSYPGMLDGTTHNLYLPFSFEDLQALRFDEDERNLFYTVNDEEYSIEMISEPGREDQFYPQPNLVTGDGIRLQVALDSSVLATLQMGGEDEPVIIMKKYQQLANDLSITMIIQSSAAMFYLGNTGEKMDRNVLQNVAYNESYLGGGGASDSIYEVVSLAKNVYIETGLQNASGIPAVNEEGPYITKQTLDLTDIVAPIRSKSGKKYIPSVVQEGENLVITMEGYQNKYPGKVVIFGGANENVRGNMQILLSHAMMEFKQDIASNKWVLVPMDIQLARETIYSLAAEDLEYGHQIIVLDHKYGPEYHFRFNYSRNGSDLHFSDIAEFGEHKYDEQHIEMTTVIITDFYKQEGEAYTDARNGTTGVVLENEVAEIRDVTLTLPGVTVKLNGTQVIVVSQDYWEPVGVELPHVTGNQSYTISSLTSLSGVAHPIPSKLQGPLLLNAGMIPKWQQVLHDTEKELLKNLPFAERLY